MPRIRARRLFQRSLDSIRPDVPLLISTPGGRLQLSWVGFAADARGFTVALSRLFKARSVKVGIALLVTLSFGQLSFSSSASAAGETFVSLTFNDGLLSQYQY